MRLSEKTIELSFTAQLTHQLNLINAVWFGLTQRQEMQLGFDACSQIAGRLLILQFKASNVIVHPSRYSKPRRRFSVPHDQLVNLQSLAKQFPQSVYYVFPNLGTTKELALNKNLIAQSWLLDVAAIPCPFPTPTNQTKTHHAFIDPPACDIRSEPVDAKLMSARQFAQQIQSLRENSRAMIDWLRHREFSFRGMRAYGLLLPT
jgi:hypothetical protein